MKFKLNRAVSQQLAQGIGVKPPSDASVRKQFDATRVAQQKAYSEIRKTVTRIAKSGRSGKL